MNAPKSIRPCLATFIALILVGFIGSPTLQGFPSTIVYEPNCDSWAPVYRWERLSMADWNTPVTGASIASPDPAPEGDGPVSMTLSHRTIDDEFQGMVDLTIDGLSLGQSVLLEKFKMRAEQVNIDTDSVLVASSLVTDGDGDYRLAVTPGRWEVFPFSLSLEDVDHGGVSSRTLSLPGDKQSLEHSFTVRPKGGELYGFVEDEAENPVGRLALLALNTDLDVNEGMILSTYQSDGYYCFTLPVGEWAVYPVSEQATGQKMLFKNLPLVTMSPGGAKEIQGDIDVVTPTSTIELTVTDASLSPLSGLQLHGFATVGEEEYHGFAATDDDGVIRLPAVPGNWALHVKAESLAAHGMKELPMIEVNVDGASVAISRQATPFAVDVPQLAVVFGEKGSFRFHGAGDPGRTYGIEASTILKNWYEIGVVRPMADSFDVEDRSGRREVFYRVVGQ